MDTMLLFEISTEIGIFTGWLMLQICNVVGSPLSYELPPVIRSVLIQVVVSLHLNHFVGESTASPSHTFIYMLLNSFR